MRIASQRRQLERARVFLSVGHKTGDEREGEWNRVVKDEAQRRKKRSRRQIVRTPEVPEGGNVKVLPITRPSLPAAAYSKSRRSDLLCRFPVLSKLYQPAIAE